MFMREWEQHKTNKWVRSSHAYAYVAGVLTCLCLCYAYACAYLYTLVRTSLKVFLEANLHIFLQYLHASNRSKYWSKVNHIFTSRTLLYLLSLKTNIVMWELKLDYMISRIEPWYQRAVHVIYIHYSSPSPVCLPSRYLCYLFQFSSWITLKDSTATNSNFCGRLSTQWLFLSRPLDVCNYYANSPLEYFACVLLILLILFSFIQEQSVIWIKEAHNSFRTGF